MSSSQPISKVAGRESGKRTLVEVMDYDIEVKRKKLDEYRGEKCVKAVHSRFFLGKETLATPSGSRPADHAQTSAVRPSIMFEDSAKENVPPFEEDDVESVVETEDPVTQEDGYISPPSLPDEDDEDAATEAPNFSSPKRPRCDNQGEDDGDFGVEPVSSPPISGAQHQLLRRHSLTGKDRDVDANCTLGGTLVRVTLRRSRSLSPSRTRSTVRQQCSARNNGPNLRDLFIDEPTSEIENFEDEGIVSRAVDQTSNQVCHAPDPERLHQNEMAGRGGGDAMIARADEDDLLEARRRALRNNAISVGWYERWSFAGRSHGRPRVTFHFNSPSVRCWLT
jgi:hypothetical protein